MTEPPRLLDSSTHPAVRSLLEAGLADNPSGGSAQRAAVGLGLSAGALVTITSGVASGAAVGGTGLVVSAAAPSLLVTAGQWLAIGVIGGFGLVSGASYVSSTSASTSAPARRAASGSDSSPASSGSRALPSQVAAGSDLDRASAARESRAAFPTSNEQGSVSDTGQAPASAKTEAPQRAPVVVGPTSSAVLAGGAEATSGRLGREVSLIDEARRQLAAGNAPQAEATLDAYAALARTGTLDREAQILRIEALTAGGQRAAAVLLAGNYLQAYPSDPHAPMLRQLMTEAPSPKAGAR